MHRFLILFIITIWTANAISDEISVNTRKADEVEQKRLKELMKMTDLTKDQLSTVQRYASSTVETFNSNGMAGFDYSENSVKLMSELIDKERTGYSERVKNILPTLWGSYLGEALIKRYGGKWVIMGNGSYAISLNNGHFLWPMARVEKHVTNGTEDSIYAQYMSIEIMKNQGK